MQQQRQLRLGDILDDYCPRERRVTNHAIVAMVDQDVKQTRCTTCDAEHEFKHAKVPRQRKKSETPAALTAQIAAGAPKRIAHESPLSDDHAATPEIHGEEPPAPVDEKPAPDTVVPVAADTESVPPEAVPEPDEANRDDDNEGPVHRPLIRATLPRAEGQPPPARPAPEFTIRQPGARQNRFRPRHQRGGQGQPFGNRSSGNLGPMRSGSMSRQGGGGRPGRHPGQGQGRKRSK